MKADEALQYLAGVAQDFARTLPPSAQGPMVAAVNEALTTLAPLVTAPDASAMVNGARPNGDGRRRVDAHTYGEEGEQRKPPTLGEPPGGLD